jgi:hypothetical protein
VNKSARTIHMQSLRRDARGHYPDCKQYDEDTPDSPGNGHNDLFCDCHRFTEPLILKNGFDIAWPAG